MKLSFILKKAGWSSSYGTSGFMNFLFGLKMLQNLIKLCVFTQGVLKLQLRPLQETYAS